MRRRGSVAATLTGVGGSRTRAVPSPKLHVAKGWLDRPCPTCKAAAATAARRRPVARPRGSIRRVCVRGGLSSCGVPRCGRSSSTVLLAFAETRERLDAEINVQLFEAALASSRARGGARLLVAVMAALAGADCQVTGFSAGELAAAAGLSATSYRRARGALLDSGEVRLDSGLGGRGNTNTWTLTLPDAVSSVRPAWAAAPAGARPLLATVRSTAEAQEHDAAPSADRLEEGAASGRVSASKGAAGETVFAGKGARTATVCGERAPKRAPQTPPPNARAGAEPKNLGTGPPQPPWRGEHAQSGHDRRGLRHRSRPHTTTSGRDRPWYARRTVPAAD
jgi:hypothetical protein